jgi:hypothetical protein
MNSRVEQMECVQKEGLELFKKKNVDYGDAFATYGPVGVIVRMGDKINRLTSVSKNGVALIDNEGLRDTLIDLHNYSAMAIMLLDEKPQRNCCSSAAHLASVNPVFDEMNTTLDLYLENTA